MAVSWVYRLQKSQLEKELRRHQINGEGSLASLSQRMVSFVRADPQLFGDKPEDGPEYKEDLDWRNDLEAMEEEPNRIRRAQAAREGLPVYRPADPKRLPRAAQGWLPAMVPQLRGNHNLPAGATE